jgi:hypothetical protein
VTQGLEVVTHLLVSSGAVWRRKSALPDESRSSLEFVTAICVMFDRGIGIGFCRDCTLLVATKTTDFCRLQQIDLTVSLPFQCLPDSNDSLNDHGLLLGRHVVRGS